MPETLSPSLSPGCLLRLAGPRSVPRPARLTSDGRLALTVRVGPGKTTAMPYAPIARAEFVLTAGTDADLAALRGARFRVEDGRGVGNA